METAHQISLTPEQIAAVQAGGGFVICEDPSTHVQYQLIRVESAAVDDEYVRAKIEEAYAAPAAIEPLDMARIKSEINRRLAKSNRSEAD